MTCATGIANKFLDLSNGGLKRDWHYHLPVEKIDGVDVDVQFVCNQNGLSIYIISNAWMFGRKRLITFETATIRQHILFKKTYIKKNNEYTLEDFMDVLVQIEDDINKMKFNKVDGVLYTPDVLNPLNQTFIFTYDENNYHHLPLSDKADDCCVCLESTKTTTPCGHKLCVMCWGKIKMVSKSIPCPYCRENLTQREEVKHLYDEQQLYCPNCVEETDCYEYRGDEEDESEEEEYDYDEFPSVRMETIYDIY
jgi:hypothetical protein